MYNAFMKLFFNHSTGFAEGKSEKDKKSKIKVVLKEVIKYCGDSVH